MITPHYSQFVANNCSTFSRHSLFIIKYKNLRSDIRCSDTLVIWHHISVKLKYSFQSHLIPHTSNLSWEENNKNWTVMLQSTLDGETSDGLLGYPLLLMMGGFASSSVVLCLTGISYPAPAYYIQSRAYISGKRHTPLFILSDCCLCVEFKTGCLLRWVGCIYAVAVNTAV